MKAPVEALARAMTRQNTAKLEAPEHTGSGLHDSNLLRLSKSIIDRRKSEYVVSDADTMSSSGKTFCESPVLEFKPAESLPPKSQQVKQAECTLKSFVQVVREDNLRRQCVRGANGAPTITDLIMPQRYFYAQGANELMKLKVVNVGPDTASLQLPAYTLRLIKLVKHRRRRLREITNGHPLFAHENRIILEHETEIFEQALRDALHMLKSTRTIRHNKEALLPPPSNDMVLALNNRKALRQPALKARLKPFADMNDFIADISVSGVTDMLGSETSESTTEIADEVQQLRANVQRVRRDIAHFLNEEEEPPILHIRADRSCSIHSLNSSL